MSAWLVWLCRITMIICSQSLNVFVLEISQVLLVYIDIFHLSKIINAL